MFKKIVVVRVALYKNKILGFLSNYSERHELSK